MRRPKVLPCGHTFCEACISRLAPVARPPEQFRLYPVVISCPTCRAFWPRLDFYPLNHVLYDAIRQLEDAGLRERKECASCQHECSVPYMRRCITCEKDFHQWDVSVCTACAAEHHNGHDTSKALTKQQRLAEAKVDVNGFRAKISIGSEEFKRRWSRIEALQQKWLANATVALGDAELVENLLRNCDADTPLDVLKASTTQLNKLSKLADQLFETDPEGQTNHACGQHQSNVSLAGGPRASVWRQVTAVAQCMQCGQDQSPANAVSSRTFTAGLSMTARRYIETTAPPASQVPVAEGSAAVASLTEGARDQPRNAGDPMHAPPHDDAPLTQDQKMELVELRQAWLENRSPVPPPHRMQNAAQRGVNLLAFIGDWDDDGFVVDDFLDGDGILLALDGRPDVPLWRATPPPPRARTFDLFRGGRGRGFGAHRGNGSTR
ncbi:hypothetical protein AAVH_35386 [Aphelenchoides avenae]|nr:hypothetical protein AAVH_35386 [Aphelenchus avenae]